MAILLTTDNDSCYIEATNSPLEYVASGVNVGGQLAYKSAYRSVNFGLILIFDQPTTVTVRNPSTQTLSASKSGDYYVCAYTINWFSHSTYTSLTNVPVLDTQADFEAWVYGSDPPPIAYNSGGAGSGYIGNSLLSNKKMVGYNVPTSSAEGTKTESINEASASAVSGKPKSGNGFARIKFLREVEQFRSIDLPLANRIVPAKFKPEYAYYYGRQEVPKGEQYYDIEGATPITIQRGGGDSFTFGDLPAFFGIYDPNSSNVVNWYLRKVNSSGATMLVDGSNTGSFSPDGNYTFYVIAGGEPFNPNGKGYFTVIRTTDWSNGWGGLAFSTEVMAQLRNYFA